ncbi:MAG: hypothetical protein M0Q91_15400 [Methanoregula sp.]|jgi:hypothetical protein|nr:hypothetical protein [Methanoregula sp.]
MGQTGEIRSLFFAIHLADSFSAPILAAHQALDEFKAKLPGVGAGVSQFTDYLEQNKATLQALGPELALVGAGMSNFYREGIESAGTYKDVYSALHKSMGEDTDSFIEKMREASGGMLSDVEIIKKANLARTMGIDLEYLPKMTQSARAAVRRFGGDMGYYYDSIISGTARQSKQQLDNLGIMVKAEDANQTYAASIGKSVNALTEEEKQLAFQAAAFKACGTMIESVDLSQSSYAESTQKLNTSIKGLQRSLSTGLLPILQFVADALTVVVNATKMIPGPLLRVIGIFGALFAVATLVVGAMLTQSLLMTLLGGQSLTLGGAVMVLAGTYVSLAGAVWSVVAAAGALLLELLPFILVGGALVALFLILQDLVMSGWDNSELRKFLDFLCEKVPWLIPFVSGLEISIWAISDAVEYLSGKLKPLTDLLGALSENPLIQAMTAGMEMFMPGLQVDAARRLHGAYQETATTVMTTNARNVNGGGTSVTVAVGDIRMERMTKSEFDQMIRNAGNEIEKIVNRANERDLRSVGAW